MNVGQHWDLRRPQHLYTSATIPVYVGQNCDLHRPQYLATSATTSVYIGQHWDLRWPHNCPGHWPVAFPDSRGPGNPTGSAQCAGPRNGSSRHCVMALCATTPFSLCWCRDPVAHLVDNRSNCRLRSRTPVCWFVCVFLWVDPSRS